METLFSRTPNSLLVWLSFDLGLKGDYDGLYSWLDSSQAKECGLASAVFPYTFKRDLVKELRSELEKHIRLRPKTDRLYVIYLDRKTKTMRGKFVFGRRKIPKWKGYAGGTISEEDIDVPQ